MTTTQRSAGPGAVTSPAGRSLLILHTHLPYLKHAGEWPVGEEWLFQAWGEAYLPTLDVLDRQADLGRRNVLTLGLTPLILHQLDDPGLLARFRDWLVSGLLRSQMLADNAGGYPDRVQRRAAGNLWWNHYRRLLDAFARRGGRFLPSLRRLVADGVIEVLGGPLAHPYLPLHERDTVRAQLRLGLDAGERALGVRPSGIWLPECAYAPGLEDDLAACGVQHLMLDGPSLLAAAASGRPATSVAPDTTGVAGAEATRVLRRAWTLGDSDVAVVARDLEVAYRVWSPTGGYPGHGAYREYYRWEWESGLKLWRVTDKSVDMADKDWYDPDRVPEVIAGHVADFAGVVRGGVGADGEVVVAAYDTELFGHWWLEGPQFLDALLDELADDPVAAPTTAAAFLAEFGTTGAIAPPAGSWGLGKDFSIWDNPDTEKMWTVLRELHTRFVDALGRVPAGMDAVAVQAARELWCAQSSDWPFMIGHDKSVEYAHERFDVHAEACRRCLDALDAATVDAGWLAWRQHDCDLAPDLDLGTLRRAYGA